MTPCATCDAKCCRYFALQIDTPRSKKDFETLRWYIAHKKVKIFVEKRKWYLEIMNECRYLKNHRCSIYEKRPLICREHSTSDCEYVAEDFGHDMIFASMEELDKYIAERFSRKKKKKSK
jgi:Fe-S-cluster containining protein